MEYIYNDLIDNYVSISIEMYSFVWILSICKLQWTTYKLKIMLELSMCKLGQITHNIKSFGLYVKFVSDSPGFTY